MEDEKKNPTTSDSNPTGDEQVKTADLEEEGKKPENQAEAGTNGEQGQKPDGGEQGKTPNPPKQDRKTDAEYAEERRRRKEREEAARKKREEEIRRQAVFDVKSGQVTADELSELGLAKIETEDDLFLVEKLRKAKADGVENPLATAYQEFFRKQAQDKAEAKAKADAEEAAKQRRIAMVAEDQKAFQAKFGKTTAEVMKNEPEFMALFGSLIDVDKGNFTSLYTAYTSMKKEQTDAAKSAGAFPTNSSGTPGKGNGEESEEDFKKRWIAEHGHW